MSRPVACRLYCEEHLSKDTPVVLAAERAHYVRSVLRLEEGALVALFNDRDGEWAAQVDTIAKSRATLVVAERRRAPVPELGPWLLFAPLKRDRIDWLVEKATELGAAVLWPVITRRTVVSRVNLDRLRAHAIEAAEQTERLSVPELRADRPLAHAVDGWPPERRLLVCAEAGDVAPIGAVLRSLAAPDRAPPLPPPLAVLVGPEGGFLPEELDALDTLPFVTKVGLGPRVLRADTAALAALAACLLASPDATARPPRRG